MSAPILDKPRAFKSPITQIGGKSNISKANQPFIMDLTTLEYVTFMGLPQEVEVDPGASWYAVASPGRNVPQYHFTGAETTVTFSISWYALQESREDVITKCKWLEGLQVNDSYDDPPHEVMLSFGKLFTQGRFIVKSAKYRIGLFNRQFNMMPQLATQELVLNRIAGDNPRRSLITSIDY